MMKDIGHIYISDMSELTDPIWQDDRTMDMAF